MHYRPEAVSVIACDVLVTLVLLHVTNVSNKVSK